MPEENQEKEIQKEEEIQEPLIKLENYQVPPPQFTPIKHHHKGTDTPKISYNDLIDKPNTGMQLVANGTFTSSTSITSLDGDTDKVWKLIIRAKHSSNFQTKIGFNNDTGANYNWRMHLIGKPAGTDVHQLDGYLGDTAICLDWPNTPYLLAEVTIMAKSGTVRLVLWNCTTSNSDYSYYSVIQGGGIWTNTSSNITRIDITTGTITEGEYWLYKF